MLVKLLNHNQQTSTNYILKSCCKIIALSKFIVDYCKIIHMSWYPFLY